MDVHDVLTRFPGAKRSGASWQAQCPAHEDRTPSLSISAGDDGRTLVHCHAGCPVEDIIAAVGLTLRDLFRDTAPASTPSRVIAETYPYTDEQGALLYEVVRYAPKDFRQRRPDGHGGWLWTLTDVQRVLYGLPALQGQRVVYVAEGEKDVGALRALGLVATTNAGGAGQWRDDYSQQLQAAGVEAVVILPDHDPAGRAHAGDIAHSCHRAGLRVKVVTLPDLQVKGDVSDYLRAGHTRTDLVALVKSTGVWTPADIDAVPSDALMDLGTPPGHTDDHERRVVSLMGRERAQREARTRLDAEEYGTRPPPPLVTLRERLARPVALNQQRIEGWLPTGSRAVLAAQYKAGKTTLRDNLIRSLIDGDLFLGRCPVTPINGALALLDAEMGEGQLHEWLRDQRIQGDDAVVVLSLRGAATSFNILNPQVRSAWAARLRAASVVYLILDCLRPILDALGLDEHHDAGRFLVAFDALLQEAGIPEALVVVHMGHTGERARGDSRLRDWPDVEWRLVRQDDSPNSTRFLTAFGRDVNQPEVQLAYESASRHLTVSGGSRKDAAVRDALPAVLAVLESAHEALSFRTLEKAAIDRGVPRSKTRAAIKLGVTTGAIATTQGPNSAILHRRA